MLGWAEHCLLSFRTPHSRTPEAQPRLLRELNSSLRRRRAVSVLCCCSCLCCGSASAAVQAAGTAQGLAALWCPPKLQSHGRGCLHSLCCFCIWSWVLLQSVGMSSWRSLQPYWDGPGHQCWHWICVTVMAWLTRLREYKH